MQVRAAKNVHNVHSELLRRLQNNEWKVGDKLPTTVELAQSMGCSVGMISKAMSMLVQEKWIEQRTKVGSRVLRNTAIERKPAVKLNAFALIYPSNLHQGMWQMVQGFQSAAGHERRIVTLSAGGDFRKEMELVKRMVEFDVQGVAILPFVSSAMESIEFNSALLGIKFPMVLLDHNPLGVECPCVYLDCFHAGYTMTKHMISTGLTKIGFFTNDSLCVSVRERYRGYLWAMKEAGLPLDRKSIYLQPAIHPDFKNPMIEPRGFAREYLSASQGLEGVVCPNDLLAAAIIIEARNLGWKLPDQLRVAGMDNCTFPEEDNLSITTYRPPNAQIGQAAYEVLCTLTDGEPVPELETILRGEIIVRQSA